MSSIVSDDTWFGQDCYVTAAEDLRHHEFDPVKTEIGTTCLVTFSSGLFRKVDERLAHVVTEFEWPYATTPLRVCTTRSGKRFAHHGQPVAPQRSHHSSHRCRSMRGLCGPITYRTDRARITHCILWCAETTG